MDWLEYENPLENPAGQDEYLLRLALDTDLMEIAKPESPEILQLLRESRALGIPIYAGALMDLPYVFHLELSTCIAAEAEFWHDRETNRLALEKWKNAIPDKRADSL